MTDMEAEMAKIHEQFPPKTLERWKADAALFNRILDERNERLAQAYDQMPILSEEERAEAAARVAGRS